jgi:hypothetical protein
MLAAFQNMIYEFQETCKSEISENEDMDGARGRQDGGGAENEDNEEANSDEFDDRDLSTVFGSTIFIWPRSYHTPVERASETEIRLSLPGFHEHLLRFLQRFDVSHSNRDPRVWIFNSIKISYPS